MHTHAYEDDTYYRSESVRARSTTDRYPEKDRIGAGRVRGFDCARSRSALGRAGRCGARVALCAEAAHRGEAMILVDTSVWIAHFRKGGSKLGGLLSEALVMVHPFVMGEVACGNLKNRVRILSDLEALPSAVSATHAEVMRLLEFRKLWGLGIGWIDAHLLASALLSDCQFWTLDGRLVRAAAAAWMTKTAQRGVVRFLHYSPA